MNYKKKCHFCPFFIKIFDFFREKFHFFAQKVNLREQITFYWDLNKIQILNCFSNMVRIQKKSQNKQEVKMSKILIWKIVSTKNPFLLIFERKKFCSVWPIKIFLLKIDSNIFCSRKNFKSNKNKSLKITFASINHSPKYDKSCRI